MKCTIIIKKCMTVSMVSLHPPVDNNIPNAGVGQAFDVKQVY